MPERPYVPDKLAPGVTRGEDVRDFAENPGRLLPARISRGATLWDLLKDYEILFLGPMWLIRSRQDFLQEFVETQKSRLDFVAAPYPLISSPDLPAHEAWRTLVFRERTADNDSVLQDFCHGTGFVASAEKNYLRYTPAETVFPDFLSEAKGGNLTAGRPMVTLPAFSVDANFGSSRYEPTPHSRQTQRIVWGPPLETTQREAAAIFSPDLTGDTFDG